MLDTNENTLEKEYVGISRKAPFVAHYKDGGGIWHETSFQDAPNWQHWNKLPPEFQAIIIWQISH